MSAGRRRVRPMLRRSALNAVGRVVRGRPNDRIATPRDLKEVTPSVGRRVLESHDAWTAAG